MDPKPISEQHEIVYWSCLNPAHRHKTEGVALACIAKATRRKRETNSWDEATYSEALAFRLSGETLAQIGARYGVTRERARQILAKAHRLGYPKNI